MKTVAALSFLSIFALSVVQAQQPVLLLNGFDSDLVSCQSQLITWIYAGPNAPLTLTITNVGVDQNQPTTSSPQNTFTNGVLDKRYQQHQRREAITVQIATSILPGDNSYVWPTVLVPQGYYKIHATIDDPAYETWSDTFHVSQGADVSCLGTTTASTTGSSFPTTTPPPSSPPGSSSPSPTSSDSSTSLAATPTPVGGSSSTNVGAIAGGTVAGVAVLVIVALLYTFFVCKPRQSRRRALARQASSTGLGSPRNGGFGYTGHGKYGGLTSIDTHTMLESPEPGRSIHAAALGPSSAGVAAAATVGLRGLDPPPAAGRKSRDRPDREKRTLSSSSNSPYGALNVNTNAAPTRRHHDSQAESLATTVVGFGAGEGKEDFDYDITNSNVLTETDRSLSRSRSGSRAHGHNYSPSEEKYNDTNANELELIPALNYDGAETRRRPSLTSSTNLNATSPSISSPAIPGAARKTTRKPVPAYDASLTSDTTTSHVNATPTTPTMDNPFANPNPTGGHYAKRQAGPVQEDKTQNVWSADDPRHIALHTQQAHELQHKNSFGPGGMSGPMYELMPDILPSSGR